MSIFKFFKPHPQSERQFELINDHLLAQSEGLYWYPYSGFDLTPVVLDLPTNKTKRHLLSVREGGMPLVLSDADEGFGDVVVNGATNGRGTARDYRIPYSDLHKELHHSVRTIPESRIFGEFHFKNQDGPVSKFPALLFQVSVHTQGVKKATFRHQEENPKWITAIHAPTHALLQAFIGSRIEVETLAIVRVGGFAQNSSLPEIRDIFPAMFAQPNHPIFPRYLITDGSFFSHFRNGKVLEQANFVETQLRMEGWGYDAVRLYNVERADMGT